MHHWLTDLNFFIFVLFFCCYFYQTVYIVVRLIKKMPVYKADRLHRFAVVIAARNESLVLGELIKSIRAQNYPKDKIDVYVVADNCTDDTADVARAFKATVFERSDGKHVGKGYALDYALKHIHNMRGIGSYDGYFVFDADNVLDENYVKEMNNVFGAGYRVVTSYRNSKNFGYNWISAGYGLWFLRESKYLNGARMICNTSCAISGTGFLVSSEILGRDGGWKYHLLTEDIEFSVDKVLGREVIGYCEKAFIYDEQPVRFKSSWDQRMRWTKGFYQVIRRYGARLIKGCFTGRKFQCFDMFMTVAPAAMVSLALLFLNTGSIIYGCIFNDHALSVLALGQLGAAFVNFYASLILFGAITLISEWKNIYCSAKKKILYLFTFPLFMFTYVPITIAALLQKRVEWSPIRHVFAENLSEIKDKAA